MFLLERTHLDVTFDYHEMSFIIYKNNNNNHGIVNACPLFICEERKYQCTQKFPILGLLNVNFLKIKLTKSK